VKIPPNLLFWKRLWQNFIMRKMVPLFALFLISSFMVCVPAQATPPLSSCVAYDSTLGYNYAPPSTFGVYFQDICSYNISLGSFRATMTVAGQQATYDLYFGGSLPYQVFYIPGIPQGSYSPTISIVSELDGSTNTLQLPFINIPAPTPTPSVDPIQELINATVASKQVCVTFPGVGTNCNSAPNFVYSACSSVNSGTMFYLNKSHWIDLGSLVGTKIKTECPDSRNPYSITFSHTDLWIDNLQPKLKIVWAASRNIKSTTEYGTLYVTYAGVAVPSK
jgi:hypothetical protein